MFLNMKSVSSQESYEPYSVQVLKCGGEYGPAVSLAWNERLNEFAELYYYLVVIRNSQRVIVVNTGMPEDYSVFDNFVKSWHPSCRIFREPDELPRTALDRAGISPAEVSTVVITPITIYTTGNLKLFPQAAFAFNRKGWTDFWAPAKHSPKLPPDIAMPRESREYLAGEAFGRIQLLENEDEVCPGIRCFWTGGHHVSSMALSVATAKGTVLTGDCFFTYDNLERNVPIGWAENLQEIYAAYDRIRKEADIALPLYDPLVMERFPDGKIA